MDWDDYKQRFEEAARHQGMDPPIVEGYLSYAEHLYKNDLPVIYNVDHLSAMAGVRGIHFRDILRNPMEHYWSFDIPKPRGGFRRIHQPLGTLREIQVWILSEILNKRPPHELAMAFVRKRSIRMNAQPHVAQPRVLSLDIENFFPSIRPDKVFDIYKGMGYSRTISEALTKLTTLDSGLPQGAPTSPALSNLVMMRVDQSLSKYAARHRLKYSRYADDITFSGFFRPAPVIDMCRRVLARQKLVLNESKTRLMLPHERQEVTGVIVNKKAQAPRQVRRKLRQEIYYINKYGLAGHLERCASLLANRADHLRGLAEYVVFLNSNDRDAQRVISLLGRVQFSKEQPADISSKVSDR